MGGELVCGGLPQQVDHRETKPGCASARLTAAYRRARPTDSPTHLESGLGQICATMLAGR